MTAGGGLDFVGLDTTITRLSVFKVGNVISIFPFYSTDAAWSIPVTQARSTTYTECYKMLFCPKISPLLWPYLFDPLFPPWSQSGGGGQITITKWPRIVKMGTKHSSWRVNPHKNTPYFADKGNPAVLERFLRVRKGYSRGRESKTSLLRRGQKPLLRTVHHREISNNNRFVLR